MTELIDTHQHLIYPEVARFSWTDDIPELAGQPFRMSDYKHLTSGSDIVGSVFMETAADDADVAAETQHVARLASDLDTGILGLIASARPETDEGFVESLELAQSLGAVGIRRILHVVDDAMSTSETFRANVRRIGAADLTFDMCFLARQLPLARGLALACPDTRFVLDHCGVPDIEGGVLDPWRADMRALAELPNVVCKMSGVLAYCAPGEATAEAIMPYIDHVLEVFGPARMLWGSDWPVVNLGGGLPKWIEITGQILGQLSEKEAAQIGTGTARDIYHL